MPRAPGAAPTKRASKNKKVQVVAIVSSDGHIQGSFSPEPKRPLIAHLPFRSTEVQFQDGPLVYDPRPPGVPEPYDATAYDVFVSNAEPLGPDIKNNTDSSTLPPSISESSVTTTVLAKTEDVVEKAPIKVFQTIEVLAEYKHANETRTLPESTTAACFWCSGCFDGRPVIIPTLEEHGVYTVYGNFCTLSCSLSYLLSEPIDPQVRWERQSLLHRIYKQVTPIQPAPPRESLKFYGGILTHDQYRTIIHQKLVRIDSHLPPVISILSTLDTKPIDFYETSFRNTSASLESMKSSNEIGLRLKRTKPLKDKESTLDSVMNLQVRSRG